MGKVTLVRFGSIRCGSDCWKAMGPGSPKHSREQGGGVPQGPFLGKMSDQAWTASYSELPMYVVLGMKSRRNLQPNGIVFSSPGIAHPLVSDERSTRFTGISSEFDKIIGSVVLPQRFHLRFTPDTIDLSIGVID